MATNDTDSDNDRWVTIQQAAQHFGRSERTIRRWLASGQMTGRQAGGRTYVRLNVTPDSAGQMSESGRPDDSQVVIAELRAKLEEVTSERDYLRQMLAASLASNQKLIEAQVSQPDPQRPRRPWWQFWRR